jgi:hypothetical protein
MGIDLCCGDETFQCSYNTWSSIRIALIEATFEYLEVHIAVTEYEEGSKEYGSTIALKQYIDRIRNKCENVSLLDEFYFYSKKFDFVDLLIQFGVGGLYALCNKSDQDGFYSIGNSYDICSLIKLVRPFLLKNKGNIDAEENFVYKLVDNIVDVFIKSIEIDEIVSIS